MTEYRLDQAREWQSELKKVISEFNQKVKKYKHRITILDVVVYGVSATVASAGLILSAITPVTAVISATIGVSVTTTAAGVFGIIAKKNIIVCKYKAERLHGKTNRGNNSIPEIIVADFNAIDDEIISDSEFKAMSDAYNDYLKSSINNNVSRTASTNSHKHNPGKDHNDLSTLD